MTNRFHSQKLVLIGGTGASVIGEATKKIPSFDISLMVSLVDDGGSTGRLAKKLNIPPVGDIRKALSALSDWPQESIDKFEARFETGPLKGHPWGNLFLAGLLLQHKDLNKTLKKAQEILKTKGQVITTTIKPTELNTRFQNGQIIKGENNLDENKNTTLGPPIKYFLTTPTAKANPKAIKALSLADWIILGPGDLGANTIAPLLTPGIKKAIKHSQAKLIYIANLFTKLGETDQLTVTDCLSFLEKTIQRKVDYVFINQTPFPSKALAYYQKQGEAPFPIDLPGLQRAGYCVVKADLLDPESHSKSAVDPLRRSLLKHSGPKIVKLLQTLINQ